MGLARVVSWKLISVHGSVIDDTFANQHFPGAFQSLLEDCGQRLVRVRQVSSVVLLLRKATVRPLGGIRQRSGAFTGHICCLVVLIGCRRRQCRKVLLVHHDVPI